MSIFSDYLQADPEQKPLIDIENYNKEVFDRLVEEIQKDINQSHLVPKISVLSAQVYGSGKTHLLHRLIQRMEKQVCSIYIPPFQNEKRIAKTILDRVVDRLWNYPFDLKNPQGNRLEWLALQILAHSCKEEVPKATELLLQYPSDRLDEKQFQDFLCKNKADFKKRICRFFRKLKLSLESIEGWSESIIKILSNDLGQESEALDWMRGNRTSLKNPPEPEEIDLIDLPQKRLVELGSFFRAVDRPLFLIFDQAENFMETEALFKGFIIFLESMVREKVKTVISLNAENFPKRIEGVLKSTQESYKDRFHAVVLMKPLNLNDALAIYKARIEACDDFVRSGTLLRVPERFVRSLFEGTLTISTPRQFLKKCEKMDLGLLREEASSGVNLDEEYEKLKKRVESEPLAFDVEMIRDWLMEVRGCKINAEDDRYPLLASDKALYLLESGNHWKRWNAYVRHGQNLSKNLNKILVAIRPSQEVCDRLKIKFIDLSKKPWDGAKELNQALDAGMEIRHFNFSHLVLIKSVCGLMNDFQVLGKRRSEIAEWAHKKFTEANASDLAIGESSSKPKNGS